MDVTNIQITRTQRNRCSEIQESEHGSTDMPIRVTFDRMLDVFENKEMRDNE